MITAEVVSVNYFHLLPLALNRKETFCCLQENFGLQRPQMKLDQSYS
jgi:hypothetical protein